MLLDNFNEILLYIIDLKYYFKFFCGLEGVQRVGI